MSISAIIPCYRAAATLRRALFAEILADPAARKALRERLRNDPNRLLAVPYRIGVACNWPGLLAGYTIAKQNLL